MIVRNYTKINHFLNAKQSIFVFGPRGTGKTYYLTKILEDYKPSRIIDLLDAELYQRYMTKPSLLYKEVLSLLSDIPLYLMIDEVQLVPLLLNEVHRCINTFKQKIVFILTGSSARKLKRENANLLAGRAINCDFFGLNSTEIDYQNCFEKVMNLGTLPTVHTNSDEIAVNYLKTYVGTYLQEEVKRESNIRKVSSFSQFLEMAAIFNAQPVNYSKIAKSAGLHFSTIKEYYSILVDTHIAYYVPSWSHSIHKRLQKNPKYYLFDNGVLNALSGELRAEVKSGTYRYGRLFENLVVTELIKLHALYDAECNIYHYRDDRGKEIDLILQRNPFSTPVAIEIKSHSSPELKDVKELLEFKKQYPDSKCFVLCQTPTSYQDSGLHFMPYLEGIPVVLSAAENHRRS